MPTLNETELYYLMEKDAYNNPRNPSFDEIRKVIKQGFKNLYPDDDRNKKPKNYYIWRTEGDERVRSEHADREGEVFSWDNPPEGGHPGEDWGCRCWAEEYAPPYDSSKSNVRKILPYDNYLSEKERREALKSDANLKLRLRSNKEATGEWPPYYVHSLGKGFVSYYSDSIEKYSNQHNLDVDLAKSIMYTENATGHWYGGNYARDWMGISKSQSPMNIQGKLWSGLNGRYFDTNDADKNIELGVLVLKRISESLDDPSPEKIGTLWNETGANMVNKFGARVGNAYKNKLWEDEE